MRARRRGRTTQQRQRFPRRDLVLQGYGLKDCADLVLDGFRMPPRIHAAHFDLAGVGLPRPDHLSTSSSFPSIRTQQPEDFAVLNVEADALRRLHLVVALVQVANNHLGRDRPAGYITSL
jgi:hypothetical protein